VWDDVIGRWLNGDTSLPDDLARWRGSYDGAIDERWYPDPFVGDLRGEITEPRLVVLGINPGIGHAPLQARDGIWSDRIRASSYSRCLDRVAFDDPAWLQEHKRNSPYWANLMRFARRWTGDDNVQPAEVLNMELYPWHSDRVAGKMDPPPQILNTYVWQPISEVLVEVVFAFGAAWMPICEGLGWPLLQRFGPRHAPIPDGHVPGWNLAIFGMPSGQRAVVSWQGGFAGPPGKVRMAALRTILDASPPPPASVDLGTSRDRGAPTAPTDPKAKGGATGVRSELPLLGAGMGRLESLLSFGCPAEIVSLIADLPEGATWYTEQAGGSGQFWHVKADADSEGALYVSRSGMVIGLPPDEAAILAGDLGTRVERRNPTTWRVHVTAEAVSDPARRSAAIAAIIASLARSATRSRRGSHARPPLRASTNPVCPKCRRELPAAGICDEHGRPA
jgi:hypothetical protein